MDLFFGQPEIPVGLGMALTKYPSAMDSFSMMTKQQRQAIIERTQSINSPAEMEAFVRRLSAE